MIAANPMADVRSSRASRSRILVVLTGVVWLLFAAHLPYSLNGLGIVALLVLVGLDVVLGVSTGWLALMPTARLDERQAALRDRAYRIGFRLIGAGVLLMVLLYIAGVILTVQLTQGPPVQSLAGGLSARIVVALLELLVIAPTVVIAWLSPEDAGTDRTRRSRWLPMLAVPATAALWLLAVAVVPVQSTALTKLPDLGSLSMSDASCGHLSALRDVAAGFGGSARLEAEVCWNRQQAFTVGDSDLPSMAGQSPGMNLPPGVTSCAPLPSDTDFASVTEHCTGWIDANGTLHVTMFGRIQALPSGMAFRDVRIDLVVTRDGKVLNFG